MLTAKRKPVRADINPEMKVWQTHRAFVRRHCCAGCGTDKQIEFAHVRTAANSGTSIKPHDRFGIPLCATCHKAAHDKGHAAMARAWGHPAGLDWMLGLAAEFTAQSTDKKMKAALREES